MAFIPSSSTIQLYAYFTQYAREKIANSENFDVRVREFSLHDDDVNYILTKEIVNGDYNKLPTGFIPDLTGDIDTCIKSVSSAINKDYLNKNLLYGEPSGLRPEELLGVILGRTPIETPITRILSVGFENPFFDDPNPLINSYEASSTFFINLKQPIDDLNAPTLKEISETEIYISVENYSSEYITYPIISPITPIYFDPNTDSNGKKEFNILFYKNNLLPQTQTIEITLKITPISNNRVIELGNEFYTYRKQITW